MSGHIRNTAPMLASPRCGARTRAGGACRSPAVHGNKRCRMHGGAARGAPRGNSNALKHGRYTADTVSERRALAALVRQMKALAEEVDRDG